MNLNEAASFLLLQLFDELEHLTTVDHAVVIEVDFRENGAGLFLTYPGAEDLTDEQEHLGLVQRFAPIGIVPFPDTIQHLLQFVILTILVFGWQFLRRCDLPHEFLYFFLTLWAIFLRDLLLISEVVNVGVWLRGVALVIFINEIVNVIITYLEFWLGLLRAPFVVRNVSVIVEVQALLILRFDTLTVSHKFQRHLTAVGIVRVTAASVAFHDFSILVLLCF